MKGAMGRLGALIASMAFGPLMRNAPSVAALEHLAAAQGATESLAPRTRTGRRSRLRAVGSVNPAGSKFARRCARGLKVRGY